MAIPIPTQDESRPRRLTGSAAGSPFRGLGARISRAFRSIAGHLLDASRGGRSARHRGSRSGAPPKTRQQRLDENLTAWLDRLGNVESAQWFGTMLPTSATPALRSVAARLIETGSPMARATVWLLAPEIADLVNDPSDGLRDRDAVVRYRVLQEIPLACVSDALAAQLLQDPNDAVRRLAQQRIPVDSSD